MLRHTLCQNPPVGAPLFFLQVLVHPAQDLAESADAVGGLSLSAQAVVLTVEHAQLRMGRLSATDQEVEDVARKCGCHDFIMGLEHGYDTIVGGAGGHLSGGERQRIAIARAMLKDAPIIIFDEATAYLDPENESLIQEAISKLVQGKTLIMVAHRLYTVTGADQLVVVNQGRIEATGTHEELLKKCPLYKEMWKAHIGSRDEGGATA